MLTTIGFLSGVCKHMTSKATGFCAGVRTLHTTLRFHSSVCKHVCSEGTRLCEGVSTLLTTVRFPSSVFCFVMFFYAWVHCVCCLQDFSSNLKEFTHRFLSTVGKHVRFEVVRLCAGEITLVTTVRFPSSVCKHVCYEVTRGFAKVNALITIVRFLSTVG